MKEKSGSKILFADYRLALANPLDSDVTIIVDVVPASIGKYL